VRKVASKRFAPIEDQPPHHARIMQTQGNTIFITGGGSGIGRGLAEAFHRLGNTVVVGGRSQARLDETVAANPGMHAFALDVTDPDDIARVGRQLPERFPELNVLINNAGVMHYEDAIRDGAAIGERTVTTNLLGPIRTTAALLPHLVQRDHAAILNVTSGLAFVPMAATPSYNASKAALHSYTVALREQLRERGVQVLELIPPYVRTHLTGDAHASDERAMPLDDYVRDTMAILVEHPERQEVVIDGVAPLRHAEANGTFDQVFAMLADLGRERAR
jgi:uncharacterized oxidoreductase